MTTIAIDADAVRFTDGADIISAIRHSADRDPDKPEGVMRTYRAVLMRAGRPNGWVISADVLAASVDKWNGAGVYVDHPGFFESPSVDKLVGVIRNAAFNTDRIEADVCIFALDQAKRSVELLDLILQQRELNLPTPPVGLSAVLSLRWEYVDEIRHAREIKKVWSEDIVFEPAAGGSVERVLNSRHPREGGDPANHIQSANLAMNEQPQLNQQPEATPPASSATPPSAAAQDANLMTRINDALLRANCEQLLTARLQSSGFNAATQAALRAKFSDDKGNVRPFDPAELDREITSTRAIAAAAAEPNVIQGMGDPARGAHRPPRIHGMFDSRDQIEAAYEALMGVKQRTHPNLQASRLSGIRELYVGLTGDREFYGRYDESRAMFAIGGAASPLTASTFADLTANVQNKLVLDAINRMAALGYQWYRRAAKIASFPTIQDARWIRVGGVGDLPTVADGAVYTELSWNDTGQAVPFVKKGGFLSLTLEMIIKDDTAKWSAVGDALGTAAIRTVSAAVAAVLTSNPTITETGLALFHATHANTGTTAFSAAAWDAVVQAMFRQTEYNSAKRLAVRPDRVLVPIELRKTALALFYTDREPGGANNDINVAMVPGDKDSDGPVIVVPEFTDATDWYALAAPDVLPVIGLGFFNGEENPHIMSVADPQSFLMFYQDALPVKARWFFAAGAVDFRGAYRQVVA